MYALPESAFRCSTPRRYDKKPAFKKARIIPMPDRKEEEQAALESKKRLDAYRLITGFSSDTQQLYGNIPNRHVATTVTKPCSHKMYDCRCHFDRFPFPEEFYFADNRRCHFCKIYLQFWRNSCRIPHYELGGFHDYAVCGYTCERLPITLKPLLTKFKMDQQLFEKRRVLYTVKLPPPLSAFMSLSERRMQIRAAFLLSGHGRRLALTTVIRSGFLHPRDQYALFSCNVWLAVESMEIQFEKLS